MFLLETQVQIILVTQINTKKLPEKKNIIYWLGMEWKKVELGGGGGWDKNNSARQKIKEQQQQ